MQAIMRVVAALAAAALLFAACGDDDSPTDVAADTTTDVTTTDGGAPITSAASTTSVEPTTGPETTTAVAAGPGAPEPGSRYVALGSSFAAGSGVPTTIDPACGRSDHNYATLVAAELQLELTDVSCGGAVTANLISEPQREAPPQVEAITADTALVTITVGGNDLSYALSLGICGLGPESCLESLDTGAIDAAEADLVNRMHSVYTAIADRAPDATIVLVTYPELVPEGGCDALRLDDGETAFLHELGQRLDRAFAASVEGTEVVLVDLYAESVGHGPCDPEPWVAGADAAGDGSGYHPRTAGHAAAAELVVAALTGG